MNQQQALEELKNQLVATPVRSGFDEDVETAIHTDASTRTIGADLVQLQCGFKRIIAYASQTLSEVDVKYRTTEKECLAFV